MWELLWRKSVLSSCLLREWKRKEAKRLKVDVTVCQMNLAIILNRLRRFNSLTYCVTKIGVDEEANKPIKGLFVPIFYQYLIHSSSDRCIKLPLEKFEIFKTLCLHWNYYRLSNSVGMHHASSKECPLQKQRRDCLHSIQNLYTRCKLV